MYEEQYYLHGQALQEVDYSKYLGVTLTSNVTWEAHINAVTNKVNRTLERLILTMKIATKSAEEQTYKKKIIIIIQVFFQTTP